MRKRSNICCQFCEHLDILISTVTAFATHSKTYNVFQDLENRINLRFLNKVCTVLTWHRKTTTQLLQGGGEKIGACMCTVLKYCSESRNFVTGIKTV
jgi:hypothetical protein